MAQPVINYLAVVAAAVASIVLGFLWYGPLFGKQWMKLMNFDMSVNRKAISEHARKSLIFDKKKLEEAKKKGMTQTYVLMTVSTLVMSYILAHFVDYLDAIDVTGALQAAFWLWLGFIATIMLGMVLWENKPWKLYFINVAYQLVSLAVMAVILAVWV